MPVHRNEDGRVVEEPTRRKEESGRREGAGGGAGEAPGSVVAPTVFSGKGGAGKGDRFGVPQTVGPGRDGPNTRIHRPGGGDSPPGTTVHREGATARPDGAGKEDRRGVPPTVGPGDPNTRIVGIVPPSPRPRRSARDPMADPPVGWLVIVKGPGKGNVATLGSGHNAVGRDRTARVPLDYGDQAISRTSHCTITYEPRGRTFHVAPGGGTNLTYVDDEPVLGPRDLKPLAQVQLGDTVLRFVPLCGPKFSWEDKPDAG